MNINNQEKEKYVLVGKTAYLNTSKNWPDQKKKVRYKTS